jgi:hypothetical protein
MRIDITGRKFGKLNIISLDHKDKRGQLYWKCKCDCGKEKSIRGSNIRSGMTVSCGCYRSELVGLKLGNKHHCWKGCGEIPMGYYLQLKKGALERNLTFNISIADIWKLFLSQQRKCALSSLPIIFQSKQRAFDGTASLDRIDSSKGYIEGNLQWVHKDVNFMKRNFEQSYFIELCKNIVEKNSQ